MNEDSYLDAHYEDQAELAYGRDDHFDHGREESHVAECCGRFDRDCDCHEEADEPDQFLSDAEADADALASAGWGTDEDYGCFGGDDGFF